MAQRKDESTRVLADDLIGAAQALEKYAKQLRGDAKIIREHGLIKFDDRSGRDEVLNQREHKACTVRHACRHALDELKIKETV